MDMVQAGGLLNVLKQHAKQPAIQTALQNANP
jgi:hypothetical protein